MALEVVTPINLPTVVAVKALPNPGPTWHVVGDNDFNGDCADDIFFQNDNGALALWEDPTFAAGTFTFNFVSEVSAAPNPSWHVKGMADLGGDGCEDIVWQNDNGAAAVWEDYHAGGLATFNTVLAITPNPNPNGHVWDLL